MRLRTTIKGFSALVLLTGVLALPATARADTPLSCDGGGPGTTECSLAEGSGNCSATCIKGYPCCVAGYNDATGNCQCVGSD